MSERNDLPGSASVAFYTVTNAHHFIGVVGLVNSLRAVGHREPVYVTDAGLQPDQRALLERVVTVLDAPDGRRAELAKLFAPARSSAEVIVLLTRTCLS